MIEYIEKCPGCMSTTKNGKCDNCRKLKTCRRKFDACCDEDKILNMNKCKECNKQNTCLCFKELYLNKIKIIKRIKKYKLTI